jgi:putative transposase
MRTGNHTISELQIHIVWVTKYRYKVLQGKIQERCREIIIQICDAEDIRILSGVVSKEHVHMHIEYPPKKSVSNIVKKLKGAKFKKVTDGI